TDLGAQEPPGRVVGGSSSSVVGTTAHALPSQRSTSVWPTSRRSRLPTAKQNDSETHETPVRSPVPASGGVGTVRHSVGGASFVVSPHPPPATTSAAITSR